MTKDIKSVYGFKKLDPIIDPQFTEYKMDPGRLVKEWIIPEENCAIGIPDDPTKWIVIKD